MSASLQETIYSQLVAGREERPGLNVFALVGGARDKRILPLLKEHSYVKTSCLYMGKPSERLKAAAPWLVALEQGGALLEELIDMGWGESWGLYLLTSASLGELRKHFRRFLQVFREDGRKLYFRFHDPRVLRAYLPTCSREELDFVFGPISELLCEGADPNTLLRYTLDEDEGLAKETVRLVAEVPESESTAAPEAGASERLAELGIDPSGRLEELRPIREALAAQPGQPDLLKLLAGMAQRQFPESAADAKTQLVTLRELADECHPTALEAGLESLPSNGSSRATFVSLAPALQGQLSAPERDALRASAQVLVDVDDILEEAQNLRSRLRVLMGLKDADEEQRGIKAAFRFLADATETSARWELEADAFTFKVQSTIERVRKRLEQRDAPSANQVSAALMTLMVGFGTRSRAKAAKAASKTARGLLSALAGTQGSEAAPETAQAAPATPPATSAANAPGAPRPALRRYTARRKALPFERTQLVIRDEQMDALGEAVRNDLAARLFVFVRERHPETLEQLGPERVREVVDLALAKSLDYGIQKVSALEGLLDLMLRLDPEFTELDEYAWAKELLESDMIEPNSKPGLIADQLAG